jgi:hypothetical protein
MRKSGETILQRYFGRILVWLDSIVRNHPPLEFTLRSHNQRPLFSNPGSAFFVITWIKVMLIMYKLPTKETWYK